jgi:7-carboxy-7-deazaguanine synthase (Cx14CxxC type)
MSYAVKEIFKTLQGEGAQAGRPAVFCRFSGCNLWSGREEDRAAAQCTFCDTDFVGMNGTLGGRYPSAERVATAVAKAWGSSKVRRFVVLTGGEPLLQVDGALIRALHLEGFEIAIETNGTLEAPEGVDWICVSPKGKAELKLRAGNELKLVYPQLDALPDEFVNLDFERFSLSPMDGPALKENMALAVSYCMEHPRWELCVQTHKFLGIR